MLQLNVIAKVYVLYGTCMYMWCSEEPSILVLYLVIRDFLGGNIIRNVAQCCISHINSLPSYL